MGGQPKILDAFAGAKAKQIDDKFTQRVMCKILDVIWGFFHGLNTQVDLFNNLLWELIEKILSDHEIPYNQLEFLRHWVAQIDPKLNTICRTEVENMVNDVECGSFEEKVAKASLRLKSVFDDRIARREDEWNGTYKTFSDELFDEMARIAEQEEERKMEEEERADRERKRELELVTPIQMTGVLIDRTKGAIPKSRPLQGFQFFLLQAPACTYDFLMGTFIKSVIKLFGGTVVLTTNVTTIVILSAQIQWNQKFMDGNNPCLYMLAQTAVIDIFDKIENGISWKFVDYCKKFGNFVNYCKKFDSKMEMGESLEKEHSGQSQNAAVDEASSTKAEVNAIEGKLASKGDEASHKYPNFEQQRASGVLIDQDKRLNGKNDTEKTRMSDAMEVETYLEQHEDIKVHVTDAMTDQVMSGESCANTELNLCFTDSQIRDAVFYKFAPLFAQRKKLIDVINPAIDEILQTFGQTVSDKALRHHLKRNWLAKNPNADSEYQKFPDDLKERLQLCSGHIDAMKTLVEFEIKKEEAKNEIKKKEAKNEDASKSETSSEKRMKLDLTDEELLNTDSHVAIS